MKRMLTGRCLCVLVKPPQPVNTMRELMSPRGQETGVEIVNCLGDICPVPLLKAIKATKNMLPGGTVMLVTDHSCVVESLKAHFGSRSFTLVFDEVLNGVWEVTISRKC